jgi:hypothetical protein
MATPNQTINYGTKPPVKNPSGSKTAGAISAPVTPAVKGMPPTPSRTPMPVTPMPATGTPPATGNLNPVLQKALGRQTAPATAPMPVTVAPPPTETVAPTIEKALSAGLPTPPTPMPVTPMPTTGTTPDNPRYNDFINKNPELQKNPQILSQMKNWFNSTPEQQSSLVAKLLSNQSATGGESTSTGDAAASTGDAGSGLNTSGQYAPGYEPQKGINPQKVRGKHSGAGKNKHIERKMIEKYGGNWKVAMQNQQAFGKALAKEDEYVKAGRITSDGKGGQLLDGKPYTEPNPDDPSTYAEFGGQQLNPNAGPADPADIANYAKPSPPPGPRYQQWMSGNKG